MQSRIYLVICFVLFYCQSITAQLTWQNCDSLFAPLPFGFHVYKTASLLDGKPNIAYYAVGELKNKKLDFTVDTTYRRRLTPAAFYNKNNKPLLVVNGTFFSFDTNQNLNTVIKNGKIVSHNVRKIRSKTDTTLFRDEKMIRGAIGINNKREADIAWVSSDTSNNNFINAWQKPISNVIDMNAKKNKPSKWKMRTAIGGGPVLVQDGNMLISNDQEKMFSGKAKFDKHPRTCMGYTKDGKMIIMVIQGRTPGIAEGASLEQEAKMLIELGCTEGINLDGGGSSCMLINGKETITPSDKGLQRPVPAVFLIKYQ